MYRGTACNRCTLRSDPSMFINFFMNGAKFRVYEEFPCSNNLFLNVTEKALMIFEEDNSIIDIQLHELIEPLFAEHEKINSKLILARNFYCCSENCDILL